MIPKNYKYPLFFSGIMLIIISGIMGSMGESLQIVETGVATGFIIFVISIIG